MRIQEALGSPNEGLEIRNERLNALQRVETQINDLKRMENSSRSSPQAGMPAALQHPSPSLDLLYHEHGSQAAMDKALSHSGPSAFGNGLLQHAVSQFKCSHHHPFSVLCDRLNFRMPFGAL